MALRLSDILLGDKEELTKKYNDEMKVGSLFGIQEKGCFVDNDTCKEKYGWFENAKMELLDGDEANVYISIPRALENITIPSAVRSLNVTGGSAVNIKEVSIEYRDTYERPGSVINIDNFVVDRLNINGNTVVAGSLPSAFNNLLAREIVIEDANVVILTCDYTSGALKKMTLPKDCILFPIDSSSQMWLDITDGLLKNKWIAFMSKREIARHLLSSTSQFKAINGTSISIAYDSTCRDALINICNAGMETFAYRIPNKKVRQHIINVIDNALHERGVDIKRV